MQPQSQRSQDFSDLTSNEVTLRLATEHDIDAIVALMNRCYRHDEGWTNEAHLIGGIRTTPAEIQRLLDDEQVYVFVFEHPVQCGTILGCISVDFTSHNGQPTAYIGGFAVHPELQGKGIGKVMLSAVETFAKRHGYAKGVTHITMSVLCGRPELLAYYERRGYEITSETIPFPNDGNNGEPKLDDLYLHVLRKPISYSI